MSNTNIKKLNEDIKSYLDESEPKIKKDYFQREIKAGDTIIRIRPGFKGSATSIDKYEIEEILNINDQLKFKIKGKDKLINGNVNAIDIILDKEGI